MEGEKPGEVKRGDTHTVGYRERARESEDANAKRSPDSSRNVIQTEPGGKDGIIGTYSKAYAWGGKTFSPFRLEKERQNRVTRISKQPKT